MDVYGITDLTKKALFYDFFISIFSGSKCLPHVQKAQRQRVSTEIYLNKPF